MNAKWCSCCCNGCIAAVRPADSIVSGVWMTPELATVVVLVGLTMLPIGLGARILSMVKSEVGDDMVAEEPGREVSRLCRVTSSVPPIGLLE